MDRLRRRIDQFDRRRNTDRLMDVTARDVATTLICVACRRVPNVHAAHMAWYQAHKGEGGYAGPWPGFGSECPSCQGRLIEVSW